MELTELPNFPKSQFPRMKMILSVLSQVLKLIIHAKCLVLCLHTVNTEEILNAGGVMVPI